MNTVSELEPTPPFYLLRNAMFGDWEVAERLIADDPSMVHARSGIGETALHFLAVENHLEGLNGF